MPDLIQVTSPSGVKLTVAKDAAEAFTGLLADLESQGYKIDQKQTGGFNQRNIAGTNTPSQHSFGLAADINWNWNPRGGGGSDMPSNIGELAAKHGLIWGGNWSGSTRDPMHFEFSGKPVQMAAVSDDDLLKRMNKIAPPAGAQPATGGGATGAAPTALQDAGPSDDDLLRRMNAIAPPPAGGKAAEVEKTSPTSDSPMGDQGGMGGGSMPSTDTTPVAAIGGAVTGAGQAVNSLVPAIGRIGSAAAEGWEGVPAIPRVPGNLVMSPIYNPLLAGAETALRAGGAVLRGGQQAIVEATPNISLPSLPPGVQIPLGGGRFLSGELTPGPLGREIAALPEAFPMGLNALKPPVRPAIPEAPPPGPRFVSELTAPPRPPGMTDARRISQLVEHAVNEEQPAVGPPMARGPATQEPVPPGGGNALQPPVGGIPRTVASSAPLLSAEDRAWVAGTKDRLTEITEANQAAGVPGNLGAAATPEQLAQLTPQQMKAYRRQAELGEALAPAPRGMDRNIYVEGSEPTRAEFSGDPVVSQKEGLHRERAPKEFDARIEANNTARVNKFDNMMGTEIQVDDLRVAKGKAAEKDGAAYMQAARPLDLTPALSWVDEQMANPRIQERSDVMAKLRKLRASLFDADGKLKTDPGSGWGMHDELMADLEKAKDSTRAERYAKGQLIEYKRIIDQVNDTASDGAFRTFLDNQAGYAARINALEILQKYRPKLTSGKTGMILPTAFHKFVADLAMRRGHPGIDAAMDIPDEVMRGLINIGKDLKRADNIDLGKARGSSTNLLFTLAQATGLGAAHLGVAAVTQGSGVGNIVLQGALNMGRTATGNALLRRAARKGLAPPPGGYDYSPLQP